MTRLSKLELLNEIELMVVSSNEFNIKRVTGLMYIVPSELFIHLMKNYSYKVFKMPTDYVRMTFYITGDDSKLILQPYKEV
jgi:hypothetical protein